MDFRKWYDDQWWPRYHPLLGQLKKFVDETVPWKTITEDRHKKLREDFDAHTEKMLGNGEDGYVERKIKAHLGDMDEKITERIGYFKESMQLMIETAVSKQFKARDDKIQDRNWGLWVIIFSIVGNGLWRLGEFLVQRILP